jgi:hypothetical protein
MAGLLAAALPFGFAHGHTLFQNHSLTLSAKITPLYHVALIYNLVQHSNNVCQQPLRPFPDDINPPPFTNPPIRQTNRYFCSMMTLFMNKYYMQKEGLNGSSGSLAMAQMVTSFVTGGLKVD